MTIHDEFFEILRVLAEEPQPAAKKAPTCDRSANARDISQGGGNGEHKEATS
jgi:hypothetical protein